MPASYSKQLMDIFEVSCEDLKEDALRHGARIEREILNRKLILQFAESIDFPNIEIPKMDIPDYFTFRTEDDNCVPTSSKQPMTFVEMTGLELGRLRAENARLAEENKGLKGQVEELADALNSAGYEIDALCGALENDTD